ncbi:hypothetical protein MMC31_003985 [Peltigera leucophlebia]|nr:hypothetical protein [Peltigera leucophlebia]
MVAVQATSIQDTRGPDRPRYIPAQLAPGRRNKRRNNLPILYKVRSVVSKNPSRKRRSLPPERKVAKPAENMAMESSAPRRSKRILDLGASKPRLKIGSTPLRPFRPPRVSKIAKIARKGKPSTNVIPRPRLTNRFPSRTKQNSVD